MEGKIFWKILSGCNVLWWLMFWEVYRNLGFCQLKYFLNKVLAFTIRIKCFLIPIFLLSNSDAFLNKVLTRLKFVFKWWIFTLLGVFDKLDFISIVYVVRFIGILFTHDQGSTASGWLRYETTPSGQGVLHWLERQYHPRKERSNWDVVKPKEGPPHRKRSELGLDHQGQPGRVTNNTVFVSFFCNWHCFWN